MKSIIFICSLLLCASLHAAYQYGSITGIPSDKDKTTAYVERGGGDGSGLQNTLYFNQNAYLYTSISKGTTSSFGAYYLDGKNKGAEITLADIGDGTYTAVDASGNPIQFKDGDAIGFWVTDANGKTVYNTPGLNGQQTYNGTNIKGGNEYVIGFGNHGQFVGSSSYDQVVGDASYVMNVQVGSDKPTPAGQPLPGLLATLGLGAIGSYCFCRRKRNRNK